MFKIILILIIGSISITTSAKDFNVRRCLLLPILHEGKNTKVEREIFKKVEKYLEEGVWCAYRRGEDMLKILKKYRGKLDEHLNIQEVLKVIANREKSGSLIRIKVARAEKGTYVEVEVIGDNGRDILFKDRSYQENADLEEVYVAVDQIVKMLDRYSGGIPYDGRISRLDEKSFVINVIKTKKMKKGAVLTIRRPVKKRLNPLIFGAIEWEVKNVAKAKVVAQEKQMVFAKIEWAEIKEKIRVGDWVTAVDKSIKDQKKKLEKIEVKSTFEYKKRASLDFQGIFGYGQTTNLFAGSRRQVGGLTVGGSTDMTWWFKNLHIGFSGNFAYRTGFYAKKFGTLTGNQIVSQEQMYGYKSLINFRHFTSDFFYGPQITYSLGYAGYHYKMKYVAADGFTGCLFSGPVLSIRGSFPLAMNLRSFIRFEVMPFVGQFKEDDTAYGTNPESVASSQMEVGVQRIMSKESAMYISGQWTSNKAKFDGPDQEIHFENFSAKIGFTLYL